MEAEEFKGTFYFGNMDDDGRIFFKFNDWSIWEYWMDDKYVAKKAATFEAFIADSSNAEHAD